MTSPPTQPSPGSPSASPVPAAPLPAVPRLVLPARPVRALPAPALAAPAPAAALWVAPVLDQGAEVRRVYLPRGDWLDLWTAEPIAGDE